MGIATAPVSGMIVVVEARRHAETVVIDRSAEDLYDLVSDITRTGEWSPICQACWWDDPAQGASVGAYFTGRNVTSDRTWETRSQVVTADRGREFAWEVAGGWARWTYTFAPADGSGTRLTESWEFTPAGLAGFQKKYDDQAQAQIDERTAAAHSGIPKTLAAIRVVAEDG